MTTNCFGTPFGDLEGLFLSAFAPFFRVVVPFAFLLIGILIETRGKRVKELQSLSILSAPRSSLRE
jgi:hypothetical protein